MINTMVFIKNGMKMEESQLLELIKMVKNKAFIPNGMKMEKKRSRQNI